MNWNHEITRIDTKKIIRVIRVISGFHFFPFKLPLALAQSVYVKAPGLFYPEPQDPF